ncbi:MAG: aminoglycoside phosphotransferase family protein [Gammaproteobacteria bacterium]|nr:aminoglycoside phosphotransferase family protein [Gammaproteobacteria bacterium]
MVEIRAIAEQFCTAVVDIQPLGNGHINDTYRVTTPVEPFVLQRINRRVFPKPEQIMSNLACLNAHLERQISGKGTLTIPKIIETQSGSAYLNDAAGDFWRALDFIDNTESLETIGNINQACEVGAALGRFHRLTQSLPADTLFDTLPGFHMAPDYFEQYQQVKLKTKFQENAECAEFIQKNQPIINDLEAAKAQGLLTIRTIHGDPKLNNFLFDKTSRQIVSLIDLDTVKPGLIHYDIGDCLRSCCHTSGDEFNLEICSAVLAGYLNEMATALSHADYQHLYSAIRLIPFELGLRFYTDYLENNCYFKVTDPQENLRRALGQFRLCASIIQQETDIVNVIGCLRSD